MSKIKNKRTGLNQKPAKKDEVKYTTAVHRGITVTDANSAFAASIRAMNIDKDGTDPNVTAFLQIISRVIALSKRTISFSDVIRESKAYEIDMQTLKRLWRAWCENMTIWGKLEPIETIYDGGEMFLLI